MTLINDNQVVHEQSRNQVVVQTAGTSRVVVDGAGGVLVAAQATDKFGVFATTPVAQQSTTATTGTFAAGTGTAAVSGSSWIGNSGTKAYTVSDVISALKQYGILAA